MVNTNGVFAFNWGVFWAALAALAAGYGILCLLGRRVPTRDVVSEQRLERIEETIDTLAKNIQLSLIDGQLSDIIALLEYHCGVSVKIARGLNVEWRHEDWKAKKEPEGKKES